ncbi:restriction endonuclease [Tropicibacter naphthalenivorans]|uniref:EcoKMrr n=1 Tax=Tropicibacter naphthalenivorans TaxID=441103 RepID=A0A0N7LZM1_9RHOB|nr:restriction endonuclease [Tropicibacter naphthalenivorans]CUH78049.1 EcoKMrr [Tropicibacter naphthalenivorans]SMC94006.1 restriction system protein [Tropicibacter naphthalenivorans]
MPVPDYQTLMRPVLQAFADGALNVGQTLPGLQAQFGISDEEAQELMPNGRKTFLADRAHWARTYLSKAGCLTSPKRNVHEITSFGRELLQRHPDRIDNAVLAQVADFKDWKDASAQTPEPKAPAVSTPETSEQTPEDAIASLHKQISDVLAQDLLEMVLTVTPARFEKLIVDLLIAMGYGGGDPAMGQSIGKSGDGGIDGVINEDALGLDAVYIQAKRYALDNKVGRPALQAFVGSLTGEGASKGVFVTTSDFSKEAHAYVDRIQQRIVLINGDRLARLMIQHEVGVRARKVYTIRSVDEDYFGDF